MKIFIINHKSDVKKRAVMEQQCSDLRISDVQFIKIPVSDYVENVYSDLVYKPELNYLSINDIRYTLAHHNIYENMIRNNIDKACILFDDVLINKDLPLLLTLFDSRINVRNNSVFLLSPETTEYVYKNSSIKDISLYNRVTFHETPTSNFYKGYFLTKTAAENILKFNKPISINLGCWRQLSFMSCIKTYISDYPYITNNPAFMQKEILNSSYEYLDIDDYDNITENIEIRNALSKKRYIHKYFYFFLKTMFRKKELLIKK